MITLLELCVRRAGGTWRDIPRGTLACSFIVEWAMFVRVNGREPRNIEDWACWWKRSPAYGYKRQGAFRYVFPEFDTPEQLAGVVLAGMPEAVDRVGAQFLAVPDSLVAA